jgi:hypothetical protein
MKRAFGGGSLAAPERRRGPMLLRSAPFVAVLTAALLLTAPSSAQASTVPGATSSATTWSVTPADENGPDGRHWIEQNVDPGQVVRENIAVRNLGSETIEFALSAADGYLTDKGRFNMLPSDQTSVDAGTWIAMSPTATIEAGQTAVVPVTISVPQNATPGDHAAGVAASIRSQSAGQSGSGVGVESRVGIRVILHVGGELTPAVSVSHVSVEYIGEANPFTPGIARVTYALVNTGNTTLSAGAQVKVSGPFGLASTASDDAPQELLPGGTRSATRDITVWPWSIIFADVSAVAVESASAEAVTADPATASTLAIGWSQLTLLLVLAALIAAWVRSRRRERERIQGLIEAARRDGAEQASA